LSLIRNNRITMWCWKNSSWNSSCCDDQEAYNCNLHILSGCWLVEVAIFHLVDNLIRQNYQIF